MTTPRLLGALGLLLALVVVGTGSYLLIGDWSSTAGPGSRDSANVPEGNTILAQSTVPASPQPAPQPEAQGLDGNSIAELFQALLAASESGDYLATARFRLALAQRESDDVHAEAVRLLELERAALHKPLCAINPASARNRLANLFYFVASQTPELVFSVLIQHWSTPHIEAGNRAKWRALDPLPLEHHASRVLNTEDRIEASAAGRLMAAQIADHCAQEGCLLMWLTDKFGGGVSDGTIPDPWLSEFIVILGKDSPAFDTGQWKILSTWLESIRSGAHFSLRLRAQAAAHLTSDGSDFWSLMDAISGAAGLEHAARSLKRFLANASLSTEEVGMLLDLLRAQHGSDPGFWWQVVPTALGPEDNPVIVQRWREIAGSLLSVAMSTDDAGRLDSAIDMLAATRFSWGHRSSLAMSRGNLLDNADGRTLQHLLDLHGRIVSDRHNARARSGRGTASRLIELAFLVDAPILERLVTVERMLEQNQTVNSVAFVAVSNGLERVADELDATCQAVVAGIINRTLEQAAAPLRQESKKQSGASVSASWETTIVRQFGGALTKVGFPPLRTVASGRLVRYCMLAQESCSNVTKGDAAVDRLRRTIEALLMHYS